VRGLFGTRGGTSVREAAADGELLFVSDLHLAAERPETLALFLNFLAGRARRAARLNILGDLFDTWIGDDDDAPPAPQVRTGLRALTNAGTACTVLLGNRDFLLGRRFCRETGCTLGADPLLTVIGGERTLLMHGDLLCTADIDYLRFRRRVRNPLIRRLFLFKPLAARRAVADGYRRRSLEAKGDKTAAIMDAEPTTIAEYLTRYRATHLIHGHTHRPAEHLITVDGRAAHRTVLAEWHPDRGEVLAYQAGAWHREPVLSTNPRVR
jgi:UDP-2,3-diacylglucosamine hydrolase